MDNSDMDSLDDSTLPELSFDDLLDPSPIKKSSKSNDEDTMEFAIGGKNRTDETLNTPGPKKAPILHKNTSSLTIAGGSKMSTPIRTNPIKAGNNTTINVAKNNGNNNNNSSPAATPILLNTKNVLPKSAAQIPNSTIKLTPKAGAGTANVSLAGKTAVRTSNGQIIYIQKTAAGNIKPGTTATMIAKPQSSQAGGSGAAKPMTIQVFRTADGNYVPIKTTTAGTSVKNTTLTLSPTSLAGRKIITSTGGQVVIKGPIKTSDTTAISGASTITTNAIAGVKQMVRPSVSTATGQGSNQKPIFMQGSNGKPIIVSNQNIVKLSPKPQATTTATTATGSAANSASSTAGTGQIHAIQIPGKLGVQYVRVLPTAKVAGKPINTVTTASTTTTQATKTIATTNQPVKILNTSMPQKLTVVQKGGITTKLLVTQKNTNANNMEYSPVASKVQKTIVTVPTLKSLNDDKTKLQAQQQSIVKSQLTSYSSSYSSNVNQSLVRKHKISEINSEIQRITTTPADNAGGPPEIKKPTPNNRVVVISNHSHGTNQPKILNNSIQQPGRVTTVQGTKITQMNASQSTASSSANNNKLYTILKPGSFEQKNNPKLYSVLKTSGNQGPSSSTSSLPAPSGGYVNKPLINKQYLLQQQQKLLQLKKHHILNAAKNPTALTPTSSTTYLLPIKIKEEPVDSPPNSNLAGNGSTNSSLQALSNAISLPEEPNQLDPMTGGVRRKHCNCSKSQCLKLYCDCFANGEFCKDCTCKDCFNNLENEDERQRAIKSCLERNPSAFKPKITSSRDQADMRLHNKGCNCKRSGCLKNYCECYEAKIPCSSNCKCIGCRNIEDRPDLDMDPIDPKIMATIANVSSQINTQKGVYDKTHSVVAGIIIKTEKSAKDVVKAGNSSDIMTAGGGIVSSSEEKQQCNFITQEVVDATIQCMITQADECEKNGLPSYQTEKMIMEELGRCLVEIIDFSIRNTDNSYSQD